MTARAREAVARMRAASDDCATFDRAAINGPLIADIMQKSVLQNYSAACIDAGRELPTVLSDAERYRLAWTSARQRAANHLAALIESDGHRDRLEEALEDEQASHAMTASSFEIFVESMREQERDLRQQLASTQQSAIEHAERHRQIFEAHLRQVAELTTERDEARAEVVRLGKALEAAQIIADEAVSKAHREAGTW
jgi:hypothetical protein